MNYPALVKEALIILSLARDTWVGLTQGDQLTDVSVLVPLQFRPGGDMKSL